jgi:hypothetical protein
MWVNEVLSAIRDIQIIASGSRLQVRRRLIREYGGRRWRKLKGVALVRDMYGEAYEAEIHWYEAHGVGKVEIRVKRNLWL